MWTEYGSTSSHPSPPPLSFSCASRSTRLDPTSGRLSRFISGPIETRRFSRSSLRRVARVADPLRLSGVPRGVTCVPTPRRSTGCLYTSRCPSIEGSHRRLACQSTGLCSQNKGWKLRSDQVVRCITCAWVSLRRRVVCTRIRVCVHWGTYEVSSIHVYDLRLCLRELVCVEYCRTCPFTPRGPSTHSSPHVFTKLVVRVDVESRGPRSPRSPSSPVETDVGRSSPTQGSVSVFPFGSPGLL